MNCIFCEIIKGNIPSNKVYEDEDFLAFHDIQPKADVHVLVIPKKHIATLFKLLGYSMKEAEEKMTEEKEEEKTEVEVVEDSGKEAAV